jgi:predicted dehydrogenase
MRIGVIGCGGQGRLHTAAFLKTPGVTLAGVAANSAQSAERAARECGARAYASASSLIADPKIDAVVVATPGDTHADLACSALAAGKHVLCEVPISLALADAQRMRDARSRYGRALQAGLIHRFEPPYRLLLELLADGRLGRAQAVSTQRLSGLRAQGQAGGHHGDAIAELLTFDIHQLMWAFGRPRAVSAHAAWDRDHAHRVSAMFEWPDLMATCFATQDMPADFPFTEVTRVDLTSGAIEVSVRFWPDRVETSVCATPTRGPAETLVTSGEDAMAAQARHFLEVVEGRADAAYADVARAIELLEVTLTVRQAAKAGRCFNL